MRILHLLDHALPCRSGYALRIHALVSAQRRHGWRTVQLAGAAHLPAGAMPAPPPGCHYYQCRPAPRVCAHWPALRAVADALLMQRRVCQLIRLSRPTLIHAHAPAALGLAGWLAARRHRLPFVYESHDWHPARRLPAAGELRLARLADAVLAPNARALTLLLRGRRHQAGAVMPGALDYLPRRRRPRAPGPPRLLYLGPLEAAPGLDQLLACLPALLASVPGLRLHLAGAGPLHATLVARIAPYAGAVRCHVDAGASDLERLYLNSDLALFLRQPGDPTAGSYRLLEAMAHGCAVLATDLPGQRDQILHGQTGILLEPADAGHLQAQLQSLLRQPAYLRQLGQAAAGFVTTQRTWDACMASYAGIYARVTGRAH